MNLKQKVIGSIVVLLLGISIATSFINYRISIESAQNQLKNISLPLSVDNIYTEVQQRMIEPLLVSSLMANNTFMRDWLLDGEKDIKLSSKYLKKIQDEYGLFTTFLTSEKTLNYYHSKGLIDTLNEKNSDDNWYFEFKNSQNKYEVNLDYNKKISDALIMFINYKVFDYADNFIGATGVGVKLFDIEKMLNSFKEQYHYSVYFIDEKGEIILFSKALNKRGNIENIEGLKEFIPMINSKKNVQFEYADRDGEYLTNTKYIEQLKLYLMVEVNKKEYMLTLQNTLYFNILVSLLITIAIASIIIYVINIYQKQLEQQAEEDVLTKIYNRRKFNERFEHLFELYYRKNIKSLTLILIDIDDFKVVNDTLGHLSGDKILTRVAKILKNQHRKSDIVARWGGEEFALLLVDTSKAEAIKIAEDLRVNIKEDEDILAILDRPLTISLGLGELQSKDSQDGLILKVDNALYEAKDSGKDKLVVV